MCTLYILTIHKYSHIIWVMYCKNRKKVKYYSKWNALIKCWEKQTRERERHITYFYPKKWYSINRIVILFSSFNINKSSNGKMFNFPFWQLFSIINWQQNGKSRAIYLCTVYIDIFTFSVFYSAFFYKQCNVPFNRVVWFGLVWIGSRSTPLVALACPLPLSPCNNSNFFPYSACNMRVH